MGIQESLEAKADIWSWWHPREETEYMKVFQNRKYPSPEEGVCEEGNDHVVKILNDKATMLETFILKQKLIGHCWI